MGHNEDVMIRAAIKLFRELSKAYGLPLIEEYTGRYYSRSGSGKLDDITKDDLLFLSLTIGNKSVDFTFYSRPQIMCYCENRSFEIEEVSLLLDYDKLMEVLHRK